MSASFAKIAEFCLFSAADSLPPETREMAAYLLLDTLGVAIAAQDMEAGRIAQHTARTLYAASGPDTRARLLLGAGEASLAGAAFAIGTQTDNLDAHDGYNPVKGHIGCAVVPALLAFAEQRPDLSGLDALAALVIGYEIAGRAGKALHGSVSDYHTSGAWNALGVAALGARLNGLPTEALRHALGIAEYHGPRSQMMREIANPSMLHDGSGMGAMVGVSAVMMAESGFTGAPAITLEGEDVAHYWDDLGEHWITLAQYIKPYPICRWAHAAIDATRTVMDQHDLAAQDIAKLTINTFHESACLFQGIPGTTSEAQYSLSHAVASMVVCGRVGVAEITGPGLANTKVSEMISRIEVIESETHNALFPEHRTADVVVVTRDGQRLQSGLTHARGGVEVPMSFDDMRAKFMDFASPVSGERHAQDLMEAVLGLLRPGAVWADVAPLLYSQVTSPRNM